MGHALHRDRQGLGRPAHPGALIIDRPDVFADNWTYVHDPAVQVSRIQNYRNWSEAMVADRRTTCLGMEYFCNADEPLWDRDDAELVGLAAQELEAIGLAHAADCVDGVVVRMRDAYPVYDPDTGSTATPSGAGSNRPCPTCTPWAVEGSTTTTARTTP